MKEALTPPTKKHSRRQGRRPRSVPFRRFPGGWLGSLLIVMAAIPSVACLHLLGQGTLSPKTGVSLILVAFLLAATGLLWLVRREDQANARVYEMARPPEWYEESMVSTADRQHDRRLH